VATERHTRIRGVQIEDLTVQGKDIANNSIDNNKLYTLNTPSDGQVLSFSASPSGLQWSSTAGANIYIMFEWVANGRYRAGTEVDGPRTAPLDLTVLEGFSSVVSGGTSGNTIVDINSGPQGSSPTTLYTTQANRPNLSGGSDWAVASGTPDITTISRGDVVTMDIDQIAVGGPSDLTVQLLCRVT
jgi:hypothetical protein